MIKGYLILFILIFTVSMSACNKGGGDGSGSVSVAHVMLDQESITLVIGETRRLSAIVLPEDDAGVNAIMWSSSDANIAHVAADGLVTAITDGEITVMATAGNVKAICAVKIIPLLVSSILILQVYLKEKVIFPMQPILS